MLKQLDEKIEDLGTLLCRGEISQLRRFREWLATVDDLESDRRLFVAFGKHVGSRCALADLEKAVSKLFPDDHEIRVELRAAVKDHRRYVDGKPLHVDLMAKPYWQPFLPFNRFDHLSRPEILRLDKWLSWLYERDIIEPTAQHYLDFSEQSRSELPLMALQKTLASLDLPKAYSIEIELPKAITEKRRQANVKHRKPRVRNKIDRRAFLPTDWKIILEQIEIGESPTGARCPAPGFLDTIEKSLYCFARFCRNQGTDPKLTTECLVPFARELKQKGMRTNTRSITLSALNRFRQHTTANIADHEVVRGLFRDIRYDERSEVSRLNHKLSRAGTIEKSLTKAIKLLKKSRKQQSLTLRNSYLCAATALALFSLIPFRVSDTNLLWGRNVWFASGRYYIEVETGKTGELFRGPLCDFLTPLLDALLLKGCADAYLVEAREEAIRNAWPVFMKTDKRPNSENRVKNIWNRYMGCGMHIARARIHTELGKLGEEGVEIALALCAQKDPKTAKYYQGRAMHDARFIMSHQALTSDFSEDELIKYFPDLDAAN